MGREGQKRGEKKERKKGGAGENETWEEGESTSALPVFNHLDHRPKSHSSMERPRKPTYMRD
jgi:hypothetical protein